MKPPKYKFYLCKSLEFKLTPVSKVVLQSDKKAIEGDKRIYIDYSSSITVSMYDVNSTYIGRFNVSKPGFYNLDRDTAYIDFVRTSIEEVRAQNFYKIYTTQVINPNYKKLSKKYAKENNQEFFRTSLEGKVTLHGADYMLVQKASIEDMLLFLIEKEGREYYKGQFNKTDCKLDFELRKCELKLKTIDQYNTILDNYENTYDLIKLAPAITKIDMHKRPLTQIYIAGENSISNYFGGTYWEADVNEAIDSKADLVKKYYFSYLKAGNEFAIKNAGLPEVNGVYAGVNGVWKNQNGYKCVLNSTGPSDFRNIELIRESDNKVLYESVLAYSTDEPDNVFISGVNDEGEPIYTKMQRVGNSDDKFDLEDFIVYHVYMRLLCDVDSVSGTVTHDLPADDFVSDNRNYKKCIGLSNGQFHISPETTDAPTKYGVNDYGKYFTNNSIYEATGLRPLPICRNAWANASLWYTYNTVVYKTWEKNLRKKFTLNDAYSIGDVIKALLTKVDPSLRHEPTEEYSKFLYSAEDMASVKWDKFYVFITQKTNILKGEYDQAAQKAEITLKDVMDMLRNCFRCYWYIEDNKLKIEHIRFFMNGGRYSGSPAIQLDFTNLNDAYNKKQASWFQSEIEYTKSELAQRYEFSWADDVTELFGPVTIDVESNYVQKDKKEDISVNNFSSDVDFMMFNPSNFSDDGFALLCAVKSNNRYELPIITSSLIDENGRNYEMTAQNWYASWPYLVDFYRYDLPAYNVDVDILAYPLTVATIKRSMMHTIRVFAVDDPGEHELISTRFGEGKIEEMTVNLDTRVTDIKLSYEPR